MEVIDSDQLSGKTLMKLNEVKCVGTKDKLQTKMLHGALESQYTTRIWFFENHYDIWHKYAVYTSMSQRSCQNVIELH